MHERRIYVPPAHLRGGSVQLDGREAHYLLHVLRLREGDRLTAFDGEGRSSSAVVITAGRDFAIVSAGAPERAKKPARRFTVAQAVLKSGAMDTVVQKCTELGAEAIIGFFAERSVARGRGEADGRRRLARWGRIAVEACRQCRRDFLPRIELLPDTGALAVAMDRFNGTILASPSPESAALREALAGKPLSAARRLLIVVGPEGDFSPRETVLLRAAGAIPCVLSDALLRAETAAVSAAAVTAQFMLPGGE